MPRSARQTSKNCCAICGKEISLQRARLYKTCEYWKCRVEHNARQRARRREAEERWRLKQQRLQEQVRVHRDRLSEVFELRQPETYAPVIIPAYRGRVTNLPEKRRRALRDNLMRRISEAAQQRAEVGEGSGDVASSDSAPDPTLGIPPDLGCACALCEGRCCIQGGDEAYLSVSTIRRYMHQHPDQRPRHVLEAFLSRLANRTYQDSCVYHTEHGCALPPEMRSSSCTAFVCGELTEAQNEPPDDGLRRVFLVAKDGDKIVRAMFLQEGVCIHKDRSLVSLDAPPPTSRGDSLPGQSRMS